MKRFLVKLLIFLLIIFAIIVPVNVLVDPYNVFHYENPVDNGIEPNKNYIKTKYLIHHKEEFDSLVFGSSRAGFMDVSRIPDGTYYDMASSEAIVGEHVNTLKVLIKHGFVPKNVLVMVDDISCFVDPKIHAEYENAMLYRVPYPTGGIISHIEFYLKYCDIFTTMNAYQIIKEKTDIDPEFAERFRKTGTERLDKPTSFTGYDEAGNEIPGYYADYYSLRVEDAIQEMKELVALCNENGIRLRVVTNPLYYKTYGRAVENGYLKYLDALADVTPYINFSSVSDVTKEVTNYYEPSHFIPKVNDMMISCIYENHVEAGLKDQGFGVEVTKDNKEEFIEFLYNQAKEEGFLQ